MNGIHPDAAVIVATVRAIKMHGGVAKADLSHENLEAVKKGFANVRCHIENMKKFGVPVVVAVNKFVSDTDAEVALVEQLASECDSTAVLCEGWGKGGEGCADNPEDWCIGVGDMADYLVETNKGHYITREKVMEILQRAEDNGFVHQITNIDGENKIFAIFINNFCYIYSFFCNIFHCFFFSCVSCITAQIFQKFWIYHFIFPSFFIKISS